MAARILNDSTICDSTRNQHLSKKSLWKFPLLYCVWIQWGWETKLILLMEWCRLKTSRCPGTTWGRKKLILMHKAKSYLILESALVRRLSLEMVDWLVSSRHVRVIQIPASYSVIQSWESTRNENQMKRWKTITEFVTSNQCIYMRSTGF